MRDERRQGQNQGGVGRASRVQGQLFPSTWHFGAENRTSSQHHSIVAIHHVVMVHQ